MTCLARAGSGGLFGARGLSGSEGGGMSGPRPLASSWSRLARAIAPSPRPAPVRPKKWRRLMARTSSCSRFIRGSSGYRVDRCGRGLEGPSERGHSRDRSTRPLGGSLALPSVPRQELIEVEDHVADRGHRGQLGRVPAGGQGAEGGGGELLGFLAMVAVIGQPTVV